MRLRDGGAGYRANLREKLGKRGTRSLSSRELLDILMGNGQRLSEEAAQAVLNLMSLSGEGIRLEDLEGIPGLGKDGRCRLLAALELARRHLREEGVRVGGPEDVAAIAADIIESPQENFFTLTLDGGGCLIHKRLVFRGTLNKTVVHPREVFVDAISDRAAGVVLVHNHPSGKVEPSREDQAVTERLVRVGRLVGIEVVDHVILGRGGSFSFKAAGMLGDEWGECEWGLNGVVSV